MRKNLNFIHFYLKWCKKEKPWINLCKIRDPWATIGNIRIKRGLWKYKRARRLVPRSLEYRGLRTGRLEYRVLNHFFFLKIERITQKKTLGDFWVEKFPNFPIRKVPENVFKTLLWGPETIRKKYWVVFEIFLKRIFVFVFFFKEKKNVRRFLSGKFSDFSNSESSRKCPENSSVGTKNNQK